MRENELIERLENANVPVVEISGHRERLRAQLEATGLSAPRHPALRYMLVGAPVALVAVVFLSLYAAGVFIGPEGIIARAYAATEGLTSFRMKSAVFNEVPGVDEPVPGGCAKIEYSAPDRYSLESGYPDTAPENISLRALFIGDRLYTYTLQSVYPRNYEEYIPTKEKTLEDLSVLVDLVQLPDETVNGVECYHYRGMWDVEQYIEKQLRPMYDEFREEGSLSDEFIDSHFDSAVVMARMRQRTLEYWIGKDDYLIRKWTETSITARFQDGEDSGEFRATKVYEYYDFNADIVIEAPLNESGELLEGWYMKDTGEGLFSPGQAVPAGN